MKRMTSMIVCGAAAMLLATTLAGCGSSQQTAMMTPSDHISLGDLGPADAQANRTPGVFALGAGDALGQAIFTNYVVALQSKQHETDQAVTAVSDTVQPE